MFAMTSEIQIPLSQLLYGLLIAIGAALGVVLIIMVIRLIGTLKRVSAMLDELQEPVNKTVAQLPDLIKRVDTIAKDVSVLTESANQTVPSVLEDVQTITGTARDGVVAVGNAARTVTSGVKSVFGRGSGRSHDSINNIVSIAGQIMSVINFFRGRASRSKRKAKKRG